MKVFQFKTYSQFSQSELYDYLTIDLTSLSVSNVTVTADGTDNWIVQFNSLSEFSAANYTAYLIGRGQVVNNPVLL